jgi:UDP-glucose 4-epimerase
MAETDLRGAYNGLPVMITGGLGMIGSNLVHALVELGARVTIVDALLPLYGGNLFNLQPIADQVTVNYADIRDEHAINQLVRGQRIICNLAAQVSYIDSQIEPLVDLDINCRGHLTLLEACRKFNPDARLLFSGSRMQYGYIDCNPVNEDHTMRPLSIYGMHKMVGEHYHLFYHRMHGIETVVFRIANPYGPRQQMKHARYGIVNYFIKLAMTGQPIQIFGDGLQIRDYVYVDDIVRAFLLAGVEPGAVGEVFNIGSGVPISFRQMAETVVDVVGDGQILYVSWPDDYERIETGDYVSDLSKANRILGWQPRVSLREGIRRTHDFYRKCHEHYW